MQKKRILALILCLMMFVSVLPAGAFAEGDENQMQEEVTFDAKAAADAIKPLLAEDSKDNFNAYLKEELTDEEFVALYNYLKGLTTDEGIALFNAFVAALDDTQAARVPVEDAGKNIPEEEEIKEEIIDENLNEGELDDVPEMAMAFGAAPSAGNGQFAQSQLSVVKDAESSLASGVTQNLYTVYDKNGDQVKMFVATMDMNVETVKLFAAYKNMDGSTYGMAKLSEQVAAFNNKATNGDPYYQGTVVAGINASYYNMANGAPNGPFVMNGVDYSNNPNADWGYFAVMKDGSVKIAPNSQYASDKGNVQEAIGINTCLIEDGNIREGLDAKTKYPRQTIGITANNKVIIMTADGSNPPTSIGLTILEQAQVMKDLGCVYAGHLDGGGSATYGCRPEGEDRFVITDRPSDGTERSISNGLIVVSQEEQSSAFDHLSIVAQDLYLMPGASTKLTIKGVSKSGAAAEIPAEINYVCDNGSVEDGVFTAGSAAKDTVINAMLGEYSVGMTMIHVVIPDTMKFNGPQVAAPYGKTVTVKLNPTYTEPSNNLVYSVVFTSANVGFTVQEGYGTMDGFDFTATSDTSITTAGTITAYLVDNPSIKASVPLKVGKESEVLFDFEDSLDGWSLYDYYDRDGTYQYTTHPSMYLADKTTGKVRNGEHSMAIHLNFNERLLSGGYDNTGVRYNYDAMKIDTADGCVDVTGATNVGFWLYLPEGVDAMTIIPRVFFGAYNGTKWVRGNIMGNTLGETDPDKYKEGGWFYFDFDISQYAGYQKVVLASMSSDKPATFGTFLEIYACDYMWDNADLKNVMPEITVYIDDYSVDYSSVKPDRNGPVFSKVTYANDQMSDAVVLDGQTSTRNVISFAASVDEFAEDNAVGLNPESAKLFIDGYEVESSYESGVISTSGVTLPDGLHSVKFYMEDNNGNSTTITKSITINTESPSTRVFVKAKDPSITKIKAGSLYYVDVVSTDIANTKALDVSLKVSSTNDWNPQGIVVAEGYTFTYSYNSIEKVVSIHAEKTGVVTASGEATILSVPVRAWYWDGTTSNKYNTPQKAYSSGNFQPVDIQVFTKYGKAIFSDDSTATFAGFIKCDHEIDGKQADTTLTSCWHVHSAVPMADKPATCTEEGYTGRTFCEGCNSVVSWGTTLPAAGHKFELVEGVLKCTHDGCDEVFTGVWTDGKEYVDGICVADGWNGNSYFLNGQKLTGVHKLMAPDDSGEFYYDFGENGVTTGKLTGMFYSEELGGYVYSKIGVLTGGWQMIDDEWHYFKSSTKLAVTGEYTINGVTYQFDETGMTKGAWKITEAGKRYYYGPSFYRARVEGYMCLTEIDGKTYSFNKNGYMLTGVQVLQDAASYYKYAFDFGADGALVKEYTDEGIVTDAKGDLYYINPEGYVLRDQGLVTFGGEYYFVPYDGSLKRDYKLTLNETNNNGLSVDGVNPITGNCYFGVDGKLLITGIDPQGYYRENGPIAKGKGLIKIGDDYYCVRSTGDLFKNTKYKVTEEKANELMPAGTYMFGPDGKMVIEPDGVNEEGYVVIGNVVQVGAGLVKIGDDYYFATYNGKAKCDYKLTLNESNNNGLSVDGVNPITGNCYFGVDGKLFITGIDPQGYYRENGPIAKGKGLIKIGDDYYCVRSTGDLFKNTKYKVTEEKANELMPAGTYMFGPDGKMVIEPDGVNEEGYVVIGNVVQVGAGLVKIGDDYYFATYNGKAKCDYKLTLNESNNNGLSVDGVNPITGNCYFGVDGKLFITGIDPQGYYRENGPIAKGKGLVKIGDDYYCVRSTGDLFKNVTYYVNEAKANDLLPAGTYVFGPDGAMIPGVQNLEKKN